MDIGRMLADFHAEPRQIEDAMAALECLARGQDKRRGRPPKWMTATAEHRQRRSVRDVTLRA